MTALREMTGPELLAIVDEAVPEVIRQAELKMQQALQMALAGDQRASALTAAYGAVAAGLLAAAGTLGAMGHARAPLGAGLATGAALFLIAACVCAGGGRAIAFYVAGNDPASVWMSANNLLGMSRLYCRELDLRLKRNAAVLARTGRWTNWGQAIAAAAPLAGLAVYLVVSAQPNLLGLL